MQISADDDRLLGSWRMIATTSGHLDTFPRVDAATLSFRRDSRDRLSFRADVRTPRKERTVSGLVPLRPATIGWRTLPRYAAWLMSLPFHGRIFLGAGGDVAAAVTPGSMVLEPGMVLLARSHVDPATAHVAIRREMHELNLTPLQVREMIWRVTAPGIDSRRFDSSSAD
ncbi:MAG: hypothetical protein ABWZ77_03305 [Naasia sp.]